MKDYLSEFGLYDDVYEDYYEFAQQDANNWRIIIKKLEEFNQQFEEYAQKNNLDPEDDMQCYDILELMSHDNLKDNQDIIEDLGRRAFLAGFKLAKKNMAAAVIQLVKDANED